MIQIGVSISRAAVTLAQAGRLPADYIVWYGKLGTKDLDQVVARKPVFLHDLSHNFWLNYADPFDDATMTTARAMLDMTHTPWLSTGIGASAEPQAHRHGPYREADNEQLQTRETVSRNIVRHGKRLQEWAGIPLLLENFNYHPTNAYEYICEPVLFSELIAEIGCGMLLDLGHARISAQNMPEWRGNTEGYLSAFPLDKVREIHFNRPGWIRGERVDLHQPVCRDDLDWLAWVLDRTPAEAVTLEIEETDADTLLKQIAMIQDFLAARV